MEPAATGLASLEMTPYFRARERVAALPDTGTSANPAGAYCRAPTSDCTASVRPSTLRWNIGKRRLTVRTVW